MNKVLYTALFLITCSLTANSQTGEIQGKVVDENGRAVGFAAVVIVSDEAGLKPTSKGAKTDGNGFYTIKGVSPGTYNLRASFTGKPKVVQTGIVVYVGRPTTQDFKLEERSTTVGTVTVKAKRVNPVKIIDVFTPVQTAMTSEQIADNTVRDVNSLAGQTAGVVQSDRGANLSIAGGQGGDNVYFVNGVKVTGSSAVPPSAIANLEVIASGIPAKYGDATGGIVNITTKGPSEKLLGNIAGLTSQNLDPYGYNMLNGVLTGPILRRKADTTYGSGSKAIKGEPIIGFSVNAMFETEGDKFPRLKGNYKLKDDKFNEIRNTPYRISADGTTIVSAQDLVRASDLETISASRNTSTTKFNGNASLDFKVNKLGTNITVGGRFFNEVYHDFVGRYALFNYENNPRVTVNTYSGYLRLYTPLYNSNSDNQAKKLFRNATIQIQGDYERSGTDKSSDVAGNNPWLTGYIGKFDETYSANATLNSTTTAPYKVNYGAGPNDFIEFGPHVSVANFTPNGVIYTPGTTNSTAASFTQKFIDLYTKSIGNIKSVAELTNAGALTNGSRANVFVQQVFYPMARVFNLIQKEEFDQYRLAGNLNFDLINKKSAALNKHTIEMGFEVEKRYQSQYNISPLSIWNLAGVSINQHLSVANDKNYNPLLVMENGTVKMRLQDYVKQLNTANPKIFAAFDTIVYDKEVSNGAQTTFSKNLRNVLGIDSLTRINIQGVPIDKLNLNLFSQDEILRSSLYSGITARGYNVYGTRIGNNIEFNDFFTEKQNGNYTRKVAPISPFYAAGYIQDRFQLKDIAFNIGLRIDYFNPVTKAFIDPYVPSGGRSIDDVKASDTALRKGIPTNLPSTAVVYVNNPNAPTKILGYRNGNQWYDVNGNELSGPESIRTASGGQVLPYLKGNTDAEREQRTMTSDKFDPNVMFKDAAPIVNVMPRLNFSFKIDTNSLLFANFDVLTQRPYRDQNQALAIDYYNLLLNQAGSIPNANLKSPRRTNLGIGFKQRLSTRSALTINFSYSERINQITQFKIDGGYPVSYTTYENNDFSTVKSMTFTYELRRTNNLRLTTWYMMLFAEGTGSSVNARQGLINANQGNLRVIAPINDDTRHTLFMDLNYKFPGGADYNGPSKLKGLFQEMSFSVIPRLTSGAPYSLQANVTGTSFISSTERIVTLGDVNAGRMPWRFGLNVKISKDFSFRYGRKPKASEGLDERRQGAFNVYLQINNLTNNQVTSVYRYTGSPETDGYIGSANYNLQYNVQETILPGLGNSFRDLYNVSLEIPNINPDALNRASNYSLPRIIQLGGSLSF